MKDILAAVGGILAITLFAACSLVGATSGKIGYDTTSGAIGNGATDPLTACRATSDRANPYQEITVAYDINPAPANGCPTSPVLISDGKIMICQATGDPANRYEEITVTYDVSPALANGCPVSPVLISDSEITICQTTGIQNSPYGKIATVSKYGMDGFDKHESNIILAPEVVCPATMSRLHKDTIEP